MSATATTGMRVVTGELHRVRRGRAKGFSPELPPEPSRRPARVAVVLALAHTIQRTIDRGEIRDQAEAARRLGLTRARMTQILDLTLLAPDLQEEILLLQAVDGLEPLGEKLLRNITTSKEWTKQRQTIRHSREAPRRVRQG